MSKVRWCSSDVEVRVRIDTSFSGRLRAPGDLYFGISRPLREQLGIVYNFAVWDLTHMLVIYGICGIGRLI